METFSSKREYDVCVIGGGAAGLMAACFAAKRGLLVCIIEKERRCARKVLITGKGRCNVTNNCDTDEFLKKIRNGSRFMYSSLTAFGACELTDFFESRGIKLKTERGSRMYPQSDKSADIANTLVYAATDAGCKILSGQAVAIVPDDYGGISGIKLKNGETIKCKAVIVATGGVTYPLTGSTGDGYIIAKQVGHTIIEPKASLVPFECSGNECLSMQGLSLKNVELKVKKDKKVIFAEQGEMLFTHFGISGPLVLMASAATVGENLSALKFTIDMKPALDRETLDKRILRDFSQNLNKEFKNSLDELLPKKMIPIVIEKSGILEDQKINSITQKQRNKLIDVIKCFELSVVKTCSIDEAVVTAGGVKLSEVDPKTMMSKKLLNLHFAGEVLDVDGYTGGYNLGIAFATGHAAGQHILEEKK